MRSVIVALCAGIAGAVPSPAAAQTVEELQRQIDELKAVVRELQAERARPAAPPAASPPPASAIVPASTAQAPAAPAGSSVVAAVREEKWYDRIQLRGYTQFRLNEILSGDRTAPAGQSRLRSVQDAGIGDNTNFSFRRIRLVFSGDISDRVSFYFQPDFATAVSNQSADERREAFTQLRDAYVDWFLDRDRRIGVRFGQSKVPFGWENLQSSSNRVPLDRTDAMNSAVPAERDIGIVAYATPASVQRIWDRLENDGQKLFGNYGAFGIGVFNGQGVNRAETNDGLMTVAMATWPFELDRLGLRGQVLELGLAGLRNSFQPELRAGGVSSVAFPEERVGLHAILYPQPFGIQAEWNWGRGPEFNTTRQRIETKPLHGGYVQAMFRIRRSPVGQMIPFVRWQHYRGGWKAGLDAPRLETDETEFGVELHPDDALEVTLAFSKATRREADTRRTGRAEGTALRTQLQWNY